MTQYSERELVLPTLALLDRMGLNHLPSGRTALARLRAIPLLA